MAELKCVKGLHELQEALKQFPTAIARNVMRTGIRKGAEVLHETCKRMAPELEAEPGHKRDPRAVPGRLKNAIYHKLINELSNDLQQTYFVGVRRGRKQAALKVRGGKVLNLDAYYWTWVEFGHFYVPPRGKGSGLSQYRNRAQHITAKTAVWIPARHFMRDAWNLSKEAVQDTTIRYIEERVPIEARKLGLEWKK